MTRTYNIIPSPLSISALQSRSNEEIKLIQTTYGYVLDDVHMAELTKPQTYFIIGMDPVYVRNIQVSIDTILFVAGSHPDIYIICEDGIYIDTTIYTLDQISRLTQELLIAAYKVEKKKQKKEKR